MAIELISKEIVTRPILWPIVVVLSIFMCAIIAVMIIMYVRKGTSMHKIIKAFSCITGIGFAAMLLTMAITGIFFRVDTDEFRYTVQINRSVMTLDQYDNFKYTLRPTQGQQANTFIFTSAQDLNEEAINNLITE